MWEIVLDLCKLVSVLFCSILYILKIEEPLTFFRKDLMMSRCEL